MSFRNPQSRARPQQRRGGSLTFFSDYLTSCEGPPLFTIFLSSLVPLLPLHFPPLVLFQYPSARVRVSSPAISSSSSHLHFLLPLLHCSMLLLLHLAHHHHNESSVPSTRAAFGAYRQWVWTRRTAIAQGSGLNMIRRVGSHVHRHFFFFSKYGWILSNSCLRSREEKEGSCFFSCLGAMSSSSW